MDPRRAIWVAALWFTASCSFGCQGRRDGAASDPTAIWSADQPIPLVDTSLPDAQYLDLGMPTFDHHWSSADMLQAAARLEEIVGHQPNALPHFDSPRSGRVFSRITHSDNLTVLRDPAAPLAIRVPAAIEFMQGLDGIYKSYLVALHEKRSSGDDVVELNGARLRTCKLLLELLDEYLPTLSRAEPKSQARLASLDMIRSSLTEVLAGILRSLSEPQYFGLPARRRLVTYCNESLPKVVPMLHLESRKLLLTRLEHAASDPHLDNLQPALRELRDRVAGVVRRATE